MTHIIFGLNKYEQKLIMEGKICSVSRITNLLEKHKNKWFRVENRMYRVLDTVKTGTNYTTYFAFMGMYGNALE